MTTFRLEKAYFSKWIQRKCDDAWTCKTSVLSSVKAQRSEWSCSNGIWTGGNALNFSIVWSQLLYFESFHLFVYISRDDLYLPFFFFFLLLFSISFLFPFLCLSPSLPPSLSLSQSLPSFFLSFISLFLPPSFLHPSLPSSLSLPFFPSLPFSISIFFSVGTADPSPTGLLKIPQVSFRVWRPAPSWRKNTYTNGDFRE